MVEFFGLLGGFLNTIRLIPQAHKSWTTRSTHDLSGWFLGIVWLQSLCLMAYGYLKPDSYILYMNVVPLGCASLLAWLKYKYR